MGLRSCSRSLRPAAMSSKRFLLCGVPGSFDGEICFCSGRVGGVAARGALLLEGRGVDD